MLLAAERLSKTFGGTFFAINDVNIQFEKATITSIIGPNGAGKTTLINLLSGSLRPDGGRIFLGGEEITDIDIPGRIKRGICRSFQITNIFPKLTSIENILIPLIAFHKKNLKIFSKLDRDQELQEEAMAILQDIGLVNQAYARAGHLSHGEQRQLEIGIALATYPKIILLDEPTQGMNNVEKRAIMQHIVRFSEKGLATFIIVEHDMDVVFSVSQRIIVLHSGTVIADGAPEEIRNSDLVRKIYLGEDA